MLRRLINCISIFIVTLTVSSCYDDLDLKVGDLGSGPIDVSVSVDFEPLVVTDTHTASSRGASGNALSEIDRLVLFFYKADIEKELAYIMYSEKGDFSNYRIYRKDNEGANTGSPEGPNQAESTTTRATFTLKDIEAGYYHVYAVANIGNDIITGDRDLDSRNFETISDLKSIRLEWNSGDIAANNQMFGYLTSGDNEVYEDGLEAPKVGIGHNSRNLHCWLKRAASKVTVAFDGQGLKDGIWIYIKDVRIKDIPQSCFLGRDNTPASKSELIENGDTLSFSNGYDSPKDYKNWTSVSKGSGRKGSAWPGSDGQPVFHSEYANALYFFENLQGNYPGQRKYNKNPDWDFVGWTPEEGQYDYKDNVPYGTYIEVTAYYVSDNPEQISSGDIVYRFMLGQDSDYDYNAFRNHHYKVTLGFRGFANQPDWHIKYKEEGQVLTPEKHYYMSYQYNRCSYFPIRVVGNDLQSVEVEIVENNWAPFDENKGDVPDAVVGLGGSTETVTESTFRWHKDIYDNTSGSYYYGLQAPYYSDGTSGRNYRSLKVDEGSLPDKVTPIWAGFLALQVEGNKREDIPTNLFHVNDNYSYSNTTQMEYLKNYFYGKGGDRKYTNSKPQNIRKFSRADLTFTGWEEGKTMTKVIDGGTNNECEIVKAPDGSITINLPMWTRPRILFGISGFSGNNPYDAYRRRAKVMITAQFGQNGPNGGQYRVVKDVFQVRRVVNPKGIWHSWNNTDDFRVRLCYRESASSTTFTPFISQGAWRAYIQTTSAGHEGFISLVGGTGVDADGAIVGATDSPIEFTIKFNGTANVEVSRCALVRVEYHGLTCGHTIFVRQGYREPLAISSEKGAARWSSFSLYSCETPPDGVNDNINAQFSTSWNGSNYINATLTESPLALGTFFKRGNYNGIRIANNPTYSSNVNPGRNSYFQMSNGTRARWGDIKGLAYSKNYSVSLSKWADNDVHNTFEWRHFKVKLGNSTRNYRVPSKADYEALLSNEIDVATGVLYSDGTFDTQLDVDIAYGFEDFDNLGTDHGYYYRGMRGVMVYNTKTAHQLFFPVGARGMGRRTITGFTSSSFDAFGTLRYGGVTYTLTTDRNSANQYRPIPFDMPTSPGAIYWFNRLEDNYPAWDMNYFDMNFNAYDYAVCFSTDAYLSSLGTQFGNGGDALPIKLVLE